MERRESSSLEQRAESRPLEWRVILALHLKSEGSARRGRNDCSRSSRRLTFVAMIAVKE